MIRTYQLFYLGAILLVDGLLILRDVNTELRAIQEVKIEGGTVGASSEKHDVSNDYSAKMGFLRNYRYGWRSGGENGDFPHMIWYRFPTPFALAEITFRSSWKSEAPTKFQIVGSNASNCSDYSLWSILYEDLSGVRVTNGKRIRRCVIDNRIKQKFLCFGIRVLDMEISGNDGAEVMVSNIRMWKK